MTETFWSFESKPINGQKPLFFYLHSIKDIPDIVIATDSTFTTDGSVSSHCW